MGWGVVLGVVLPCTKMAVIMSDNTPTFKEWMGTTLCLYGAASRRQGEAIALKDHAARRAWGREAARHQTLMYQLISRIREGSDLGEDITKEADNEDS